VPQLTQTKENFIPHSLFISEVNFVLYLKILLFKVVLKKERPALKRTGLKV